MAQGEPKITKITMGSLVAHDSTAGVVWDTSSGWSTDKIEIGPIYDPSKKHAGTKWTFSDPELVELRRRVSELEERLEETPLPSLSHPADAFMLRLCKVMKLEPSRVSRIVMDLQVGQPIKCFVEYFAGDEILKLELPTELEIHHVGKGKEEISHTF